MSNLPPIPELPPWTRRWLAANAPAEAPPWRPTVGGWSFRLIEGTSFSLVSYRLDEATGLAATDFEEACYAVYRQLAEDLERSPSSHPVRLWNFIPHILEPLGRLDHRYMVFNAGRYRALRDWLGSGGLASKVATASGVGHFGRDLHVHCLAAGRPGEPIENPRQVPAYRYSDRFGPLPPCFARATRWQGRRGFGRWLMVGGTASVRGEDSHHDGDLRRQLDETLYNLAAVVRAAEGEPCAHLSPEEVRALLRRYGELRVYLVNPSLQRPVAQRLEALLADAARVEYVHADLCRPELLVEIEGLASLTAGPQAAAAGRPPATAQAQGST